MKLQTVPAHQGALWVRQAFGTFLQKPLAYSGLFAAFMFFALLMLLVPFVGPMLLLMALPLVSLGFMIATRQSIGDTFPLPSVFIDPLRTDATRRTTMIKLGVAYALATVLIMWLSQAIDGGRFEALQQAMIDNDSTAKEVEALMSDGRLQFGVLVRLSLAALLSIPFWHAPALAHWGGQTFGQALFSSTLACWRNKGAFIVYALTWVGLVVVFVLVANMVFSLLGQPRWMALAAMPAGLIFSTAFYASLYFTYRDCFVQDDVESAAPATPHDA